VLPEIDIEVHDVLGPPVGATHRGAILAELLAARATIGRAAGDPLTVTSPNGATATVTFNGEDLDIVVDAGEPLCEITLRSYVMGAAHQAVSMVWSEGIALTNAGEPVDLTIRSFGVLSAASTPPMNVTVQPSPRPSVAAGGAVFAATLAAVWLHEGGTSWPTRRKDIE
jgi:CO/xanthine dehydrogenase Mo-binding subunit